MIKLIGITGKAGSGKDFLAKNVLRPQGYHQLAFAWPLKLDAMAINGWSYEDVFVTKPPEVRKFLQEYGVSKRESTDEGTCWIERLHNLRTVLEREAWFDKFVISDVRFPNELAYIWDNGGRVVRLLHGDRPYPLAETPAAGHSSETALDDYGVDLEIINGSGVRAFDLARPLVDWTEQFVWEPSRP